MKFDFNDVFYPEEKLKNIRLTGNSPCIDCSNIHRFYYGTSVKELVENQTLCDKCIKLSKYHHDCMVKLKWYEDNDNNIKDAERKSEHIYDCGQKCDKLPYKFYGKMEE